MSQLSLYDLLRKMDGDHVMIAYQGEINSELLESVYTMIGKHLEEKQIPGDKKKKIFHILTEALQNVFHHQETGSFVKDENAPLSGFIIKSEKQDTYSIVTGNYIQIAKVENLKRKLEHVNSLSPEELKTYYQQSLAGNEFSEKGGAGLGIIDMARKSGNKLNYEFTKINDDYCFFALEIRLGN